MPTHATRHPAFDILTSRSVDKSQSTRAVSCVVGILRGRLVIVLSTSKGVECNWFLCCVSVHRGVLTSAEAHRSERKSG